jgi:hypothetical protein
MGYVAPWAPGRASGRCPHCETGHMEQRVKSFGTFMLCVGGCGRSGGGPSGSDPHLNDRGEVCDDVRPTRGPCSTCGRSK